MRDTICLMKNELVAFITFNFEQSSNSKFCHRWSVQPLMVFHVACVGVAKGLISLCFCTVASGLKKGEKGEEE